MHSKHGKKDFGDNTENKIGKCISGIKVSSWEVMNDHIFTVKCLLEKCREKDKNIGLVFIDLTKKYDSVTRNRW